MSLLAALALVMPAQGGSAPVPTAGAGAAIDTAVQACEQWLLEPRTWAENIAAFPKASGLAQHGLRAEPGVPDVALPPPSLRRALHHWRVPIGEGGVYVTASDQLPMCHLAGGGPDDLQPEIEAALAAGDFGTRWMKVSENVRGGLRSTRYASRVDPALTMTVSRAGNAKARGDRVQFVVTAQYKTGN